MNKTATRVRKETETSLIDQLIMPFKKIMKEKRLSFLMKSTKRDKINKNEAIQVQQGKQCLIQEVRS